MALSMTKTWCLLGPAGGLRLNMEWVCRPHGSSSMLMCTSRARDVTLIFLNGPTVYPFVDGAWGNILTEVVEPGKRWISKDLAPKDVQAENPKAKYPRLSYGGNGNNYRASTFWLRDGAYLRFKTLDIGYTVPGKIATRLRLSNMRMYLLAQNLMVWDAVKVWDPEMASSDGTRYPLPRTLTIGMTFKF